MSESYTPSVLAIEEDFDAEVTASGKGSLYLSMGEGKFERKATNASVHVVRCANFKTWFNIYTSDGKRVIKQDVSHTMNLITNPTDNAIIWTFFHGGRARVWSFRFAKNDQMSLITRKLRVGMWEKERKEEFKELKDEDQRGVEEDDMDVDYETEDEEDEEEIYGLKEKFIADRFPERKTGSTVEKNSVVEAGMKLDRNYVVRGSEMGVFKGGYGSNDVSYVGKIKEIRDTNGDLFSPEKVFLHDKDTKMIMLPSENCKRALVMDIESGKVTEEWKGGEDFQIKDLFPGTKYQQLTGGNLIAGCNDKTVFRFDQRLPGSKLADKKIYKTNYKFSNVTTNEAGNLAVGSEMGELRLYSEASKMAKVMFPGLGDPIKGVDTTADGKWVLATCKRYLLLYNVQSEKGHTGFQKRLLKGEKPAPLKLQITPSDIERLGIKEINFNLARFSVGSREEQMISTSTGQYLIVWSFSAIKKNAAKARYQYRIKRLSESVVGGQFTYDAPKMIVATENDVMLQKVKAEKAKPKRRRGRYQD